jgi:hypothetical protein
MALDKLLFHARIRTSAAGNAAWDGYLEMCSMVPWVMKPTRA